MEVQGISKDVLERLLNTEKLKYCFECGICTAACPVVRLLGDHYNPRVLLEKVFTNDESVIGSDELWLCAWCYRCYRRCPQALKLPEIFLSMKKIAMQRGETRPLEDALLKIVECIPLPAVASLVCFHHERAGLDRKEILEDIRQIRKKSLETRARTREEASARNAGRRVAVIGSGPAGLTVTSELSQRGYSVTVFESLPEPGGMLRECIPEYRLPEEVLNEEIQAVEASNVEIKTNVSVGKELEFVALWEEGYEAVFIGAGAHKCQELQIEGRSLKGVFHALDFLRSVRQDKKETIGRNVVVVGGGNVALDAARASLSLQAEEVTILYRRSMEEMPANPWEVKEAEAEGVKFEFLVSPKKVLGKKGRVSAIECVRMELGELDDTGRRKPNPIEDSEFILETDMIILGIGETPDLEFLPEEIELNEDGTIWVNPITMETSLQGVYAGGDVVTGPATVIEAVESGKQAAISIENYLKSIGGKPSGRDKQSRI